LQEWCFGRKFGLNAAKCKSISFTRNKKQIGFNYRIGGHELDVVEEIKDLGTRMSFLSHVVLAISKLARMLGFKKSISRNLNDHYTDKALFVSLVRPNLEYAACVWTAIRRELSVSNINLLGSVFAGFVGQSIQHMTLGVPR
jgi:hypothetical protein